MEFGLLAPVFFAILTGIVDFGYLFATRYAASAAAEDAARAGSLVAGPAAEGVAADAARARWDDLGFPSTPTVTVTREGDPVMLVVRVDVDPVPLIGLAPTAPFHVTAARRMEQP